MQQITTAWPLNVAMAEAIDNDAELQAILAPGGVYSGVAKKRDGIEPGVPRIVLMSSEESKRSVFGKPGNDNNETLHIWSSLEGGKQQPLAIYRHLLRLFGGQALAIPGYGNYRINLRLVGSLPDPSDLMHTVVEISAWILQG
jgi:hypothetical protein